MTDTRNIALAILPLLLVLAAIWAGLPAMRRYFRAVSQRVTWDRSIQNATLSGAGDQPLEGNLVLVNTSGEYSPGYSLIIRLDNDSENYLVAFADPGSLADIPIDLPASGLDWGETLSFISDWGVKRFPDSRYADAVELRHFSNLE